MASKILAPTDPEIPPKKPRPSLPQHLLWEYDIQRFDYDKSYFIAIERVIERGTIGQWQSVQHYYGKEKILKVARKSKQLSKRDKQFAEIFVNSTVHDVDNSFSKIYP